MRKRLTRCVACAGILALTSLAGCATTAPSRAPEGSVPSHQTRLVLVGPATDLAQPMQAMRPLASDVEQQFTTGSGQTNLAEVAIGQLAAQLGVSTGAQDGATEQDTTDGSAAAPME